MSIQQQAAGTRNTAENSDRRSNRTANAYMSALSSNSYEELLSSHGHNKAAQFHLHPLSTAVQASGLC